MPSSCIIAAVLSRSLPWLLLLASLVAFGNAVAELNRGESGRQIWIELMTNVTRTRGFAFAFGVFAVVYGMRERSARIRSDRYLRARISELERQMVKSEQQ